MAIKMVTFNNQTVEASDDALLNYYLFSNKDGYINSAGTFSASIVNNYITFSKCSLIVQGRLIHIEEGTSIYVATDSKKYGVVYLDIDLEENTVTLAKKENTNNSFSFTKDNLFEGGTKYEFALFYYYKTTSSIGQTSPYNSVPRLYNSREVAETYFDDAMNYIDENLSFKASSRQNSYKVYFDISDYQNDYGYGSWLFVIQLSSGYTIIFPGRLLSNSGSSSCTMLYDIGGTSYSMIIEYAGGTLIFTTGNTSHIINYIYIYR